MKSKDFIDIFSLLKANALRYLEQRNAFTNIRTNIHTILPASKLNDVLRVVQSDKII